MITKFDASAGFFSMVRFLRKQIPSLKCTTGNQQFILEHGNISFFLVLVDDGIALLQKNINESGYWQITQFNQLFTDTTALSQVILAEVV
ncbi:hypothetical protein GM3709_2313 [Geminocystis sp. NIES-3709]|nr:hypothetical protein GM3709_2313 [Geminocystis sp. NIES-3709]